MLLGSLCFLWVNCWELLFALYSLVSILLFIPILLILKTVSLVDLLDRHVGSLTMVVVAVVSYIIFSIFAHIIGVGVDTVMICYLEDMERNKDGALYISPDLHKMLERKANKSRERNLH